jgi:LysM repeat protein
MKKLFCLLLLLPLFAVAQKVITHTVGPKESLSSIGRLYNINGRELANYNKIDYDKGLTLGQVLKIPVNNANAANNTVPAPVKEVAPVKTIPPVVKPVPVAKESNAPVYHTVGKKQTLYAISKLFNVAIPDIKKWNNLTADALSEGSKIIVGYGAKKQPPAAEQNVTKAPPVVIKETPVVKKPEEKEIPVVNKPAEVKTVIKEEIPQPVKSMPVVTAPVNNAKATDFKGGIFKNVFDEQTKGKQLVSETGTAGIFKSTSGWEDGKYYCLHNNAAAGTIIKITNAATGKSVYAKVLDLIPDIKQNSGLIIRLSNAAADVLGVTDTKLDCTLNYSK